MIDLRTITMPAKFAHILSEARESYVKKKRTRKFRKLINKELRRINKRLIQAIKDNEFSCSVYLEREYRDAIQVHFERSGYKVERPEYSGQLYFSW